MTVSRELLPTVVAFVLFWGVALALPPFLWALFVAAPSGRADVTPGPATWLSFGLWWAFVPLRGADVAVRVRGMATMTDDATPAWARAGKRTAPARLTRPFRAGGQRGSTASAVGRPTAQ